MVYPVLMPNVEHRWIVGQAGLVGTIALFTIGYFLTSTTTLSLSAISTNGQVKGGGNKFQSHGHTFPESA